jgi:ketosteroid isomerase-like protein
MILSDEEDTMNPEEVFMLFVTAINRHDVQALTALMAPDYIFIDSVGAHRVKLLRSS